MVAHPGPPRAIILNNQQNAVRLRLIRFLLVVPAYKSKLLTQSLQTKNASLLAMHFADFQVIRLGFAKVRCFTAKSYTLPTLLVLVNALIYSVVNVFVAVWLGVKMPDFA